jgi:mannose-6-phosphate isomerase
VEPDRRGRLRDAIRRPLPLTYHPLYRFYEGGSLTRRFRGLPDRPDDRWSEDWVGSCTPAGGDDPDGRPQGLSTVCLDGAGTITLAEIVQELPEEMVGAPFAGRWGPVTGVLVKLLSPAAPVPLHAHPTRDWAQQNLGSRFGKTEAWILLDAQGDGEQPAHVGIGFAPGIDRDWFAAAVRRHDNAAIRATLNRTEVHSGEVYVAYGGVPHYQGPRISFLAVQEPTDHIVIAETSGDDDTGATMGLGWDLALDMVEYTGVSSEQALARARQRPRVLRASHASREVRLVHDDVLPFFDATALEVADELEVADGRFAVAVVTAGQGTIEGDFGRQPIRRGETYALPASLPFRVRAEAAGTEPVHMIRCLGPAAP